MTPTAIPDPKNPGKFIAVWPGGTSSGWSSQTQAQKHAEEMAKIKPQPVKK